MAYLCTKACKLYKTKNTEVFYRMQEGFALRAKKAVKRVAAFGAGLTMVGATMSGAFAAGTLADYPSPFVSGGQFVDVALVVGKDAKSEDNLALTDIASKLSTVAASGSSSSSSSSTITGGITADIPLSKAIASTTGNEFETSLDNGDIEALFDGTIAYRSADYDVSEMLLISADTTTNNTVYPQTSLTSSDDDYEDNVFLETARDAIKYYYSFDETINLTSPGTTSDYPLEIDFLGKPFRITDVDLTNAKITATIGDEYFMKVDDTVTVNGHTVTLMNVGSTSSIQIKVDDEVTTVSSGSTKDFGSGDTAIQVYNKEVFYEANDVTQRSATLVMGDNARQTFKDNDDYSGYEDEWVWNINSVGGGTTTLINNATGIYENGFILGVENDFVKDDSSDNPLGIGECYSLPNDFISICLDGLSVADDDYMELVQEYVSGIDLTKAGFSSLTSEPALYIHVNKDEGLVVDQSDLNSSNGTAADRKTDKIWIYSLGGNSRNPYVFYEDSAGDIQLAGNLTSAWTLTYPGTLFAHLDFGDITGTDVQLYATANHTMNITVRPYDPTDMTGNDDDIKSLWSYSSGKIDSLGATRSSEEAGEVMWVGVSKNKETTIGTKDEDHRTKFGTIVKDQKSHGASDEVVLEIPSDIVLADISITGTRTPTTEVSSPTTDREAPTPMLDSEVTTSTRYNVITVGGPCVNSVSAELLGLAANTCGDASGIEKDTAIIELKANGAKWAMVVAGWEAADTRRAGIVLKNYPSFFDATTGTSVTVKGTGISVSGITVE